MGFFQSLQFLPTCVKRGQDFLQNADKVLIARIMPMRGGVFSSHGGGWSSRDRLVAAVPGGRCIRLCRIHTVVVVGDRGSRETCGGFLSLQKTRRKMGPPAPPPVHSLVNEGNKLWRLMLPLLSLAPALTSSAPPFISFLLSFPSCRPFVQDRNTKGGGCENFLKVFLSLPFPHHFRRSSTAPCFLFRGRVETVRKCLPRRPFLLCLPVENATPADAFF